MNPDMIGTFSSLPGRSENDRFLLIISDLRIWRIRATQDSGHNPDILIRLQSLKSDLLRLEGKGRAAHYVRTKRRLPA